MGDGSLSQEEIDALLTGATNETPAFSATPEVGGERTALSFNFLAGELTQILPSTSASASTLLGRQINLSNVVITQINSENMPSEMQTGGVFVSANLGSNPIIMFFSDQQAKRIAMLIMGASNEPDRFDEAHFSAIGELASSIFSSVSGGLSGKFSEDMDPSKPNVKTFTVPQDVQKFPSPNTLKIGLDINIDGESFGQLLIFLDESGPLKWSQKMEKPQDTASGGQMSELEGFTDLDQMTDLTSGNPMAGGLPMGGQKMNPVNFPTFQRGGGSAGLPPNYDLILDVQMVLTVELGRTTKYVKDVLKLGEGSIIELDKLAGEPVDLLINGKLIAKGEVVVIDENFGVRVTDIVAPAERLAQLATGSQ